MPPKKKASPVPSLNRRIAALAYARDWVGTPYSYGGDDPDGIDCSGFVIEVQKSVGDLPRGFDATAETLLAHYTARNCRVAGPVPAALVFLLDSAGHAFHVELCLNDWQTIGASGGVPGTGQKREMPADIRERGSRIDKQVWEIWEKITRMESANDRAAFVKIRPLPDAPQLVFADPYLNEEPSGGTV